MADVNWTKYNCDICRAIGFALAGIAAGLLIWLLSQTSIPVWLLAVLFLIVWAVLFFMVDHHCQQRSYADQSVDAGIAASSAAKPAVEDSVDAAAEAESASEAAAAQEAERQAAAQAAAEQAAADEAEREAAEAREAALQAERQAAEDRAVAEKAAAEQAAREAEAARAQAAGETDHDGDGVVEGSYEGTRPESLEGPRGGVADDLKRIKGIGPKLEILCNSLGFYHFDQIAKWTSDEVAWVDANLEGFKGRVTRDQWVRQADVLAKGGETEFSKRVDDGDVPSSQ